MNGSELWIEKERHLPVIASRSSLPPLARRQTLEGVVGDALQSQGQNLSLSQGSIGAIGGSIVSGKGCMSSSIMNPTRRLLPSLTSVNLAAVAVSNRKDEKSSVVGVEESEENTESTQVIDTNTSNSSKNVDHTQQYTSTGLTRNKNEVSLRNVQFKITPNNSLSVSRSKRLT